MRTIKDRLTNDGPGFCDHFLQELQEAFEDKAALDKAHDRLSRLKQRGRRIEVHLQEFEDLLGRATALEAVDSQKIMWLRNSLDTPIRECVALRQIELSHDDIDRIPNTAKFRIMDEVLNTTKRRLQEYAQNCESYTEMMSVLRHQTVGTIQDPTAQVQRQLSNFEFLLGETLSELLDRYDDLMTGAQVTGLGLEERSKITHVMSAVGKHYESLETLI
ncbi:uncharacterized protein BROUX77_007638 [Berkeleyomyces rouxiae]|uniref:uncharacterized protein n=1 Tax=Berkeleyomyces rouxiae TaxID=2035830 RepID=UPI003B7DBAAC